MRPESVGGFIVLEPTDCNYHTAEIIIGYCGALQSRAWLVGRYYPVYTINYIIPGFFVTKFRQKRQLISLIDGQVGQFNLNSEFWGCFRSSFLIMLHQKSLQYICIILGTVHWYHLKAVSRIMWAGEQRGQHQCVAGCRILHLKSIVTHPPPVLAWRRVIIIPKLMSSTQMSNTMSPFILFDRKACAPPSSFKRRWKYTTHLKITCHVASWTAPYWCATNFLTFKRSS